jgi:hypothetical protein
MYVEVRHHPPTQSIGLTYNFKISRLVELMRPALCRSPEVTILICPSAVTKRAIARGLGEPSALPLDAILYSVDIT